jgi:hypothetical protein
MSKSKIIDWELEAHKMYGKYNYQKGRAVAFREVLEADGKAIKREDLY